MERVRGGLTSRNGSSRNSDVDIVFSLHGDVQYIDGRVFDTAFNEGLSLGIESEKDPTPGEDSISRKSNEISKT